MKHGDVIPNPVEEESEARQDLNFELSFVHCFVSHQDLDFLVLNETLEQSEEFTSRAHVL